jgi:hypothetical protein
MQGQSLHSTLATQMDGNSEIGPPGPSASYVVVAISSSKGGHSK